MPGFHSLGTLTKRRTMTWMSDIVKGWQGSEEEKEEEEEIRCVLGKSGKADLDTKATLNSYQTKKKKHRAFLAALGWCQQTDSLADMVCSSGWQVSPKSRYFKIGVKNVSISAGMRTIWPSIINHHQQQQNIIHGEEKKIRWPFDLLSSVVIR